MWLENHGKLNVGILYKETKNVEKVNRFLKIKTSPSLQANDKISPDNRAGDTNADDIKWDAPKRTRTYTFGSGQGVYAEEAKLKTKSEPKESNFSKDKEKSKVKTSLSASRIGNPPGVGPEFDTRTSGQGLTGGAGLGNQTYSENQEYSNASPASTAFPSGGSPNPLSGDYTKPKDFDKFRKTLKKEAIDDPGANDMGVSGTLSGASNKEGMDTYKDVNRNIGITIQKKKKKGAK